MGKRKAVEVEIETRDIEDAPDEVKANFRRLVQEGSVEFSPQVKRKLKELGISHDEVLAVMLQSVGGTH